MTWVVVKGLAWRFFLHLFRHLEHTFKIFSALLRWHDLLLSTILEWRFCPWVAWLNLICCTDWIGCSHEYSTWQIENFRSHEVVYRLHYWRLLSVWTNLVNRWLLILDIEGRYLTALIRVVNAELALCVLFRIDDVHIIMRTFSEYFVLMFV